MQEKKILENFLNKIKVISVTARGLMRHECFRNDVIITIDLNLKCNILNAFLYVFDRNEIEPFIISTSYQIINDTGYSLLCR